MYPAKYSFLKIPKNKIAFGLLVGYFMLSLVSLTIEQNPDEKLKVVISTSIQESPTNASAEHFRPPIFSQLNQLHNRASHLRNLTPAVQSQIAGCFDQKLFHQTNSVLIANQSVLPESILERSQILRI